MPKDNKVMMEFDDSCLYSSQFLSEKSSDAETLMKEVNTMIKNNGLMENHAKRSYNDKINAKYQLGRATMLIGVLLSSILVLDNAEENNSRMKKINWEVIENNDCDVGNYGERFDSRKSNMNLESNTISYLHVSNLWLTVIWIELKRRYKNGKAISQRIDAMRKWMCCQSLWVFIFAMTIRTLEQENQSKMKGKSLIQERIITIENKPAFTPEDHVFLDQIDRDLMQILVTADTKCSQFRRFPWNPDLHYAFVEHRYWLICLSKVRTKHSFQHALQLI